MFDLIEAMRLLEKGRLEELREKLIEALLVESALNVRNIKKPELLTFTNIAISPYRLGKQVTAVAEYRGEEFEVSAYWF